MSYCLLQAEANFRLGNTLDAYNAYQEAVQLGIRGIGGF